MKKIALIPARYASTRFPAKLLSNLGGKPVIVQTYLATLKTKLFDQIVVATDNDDIEKAIADVGGTVFRSKKKP